MRNYRFFFSLITWKVSRSS